MEDLLTNKSIVSLLNDEISLDDADSLAYTQVFPYEYLPETVQNGHTYICFDVDVTSVSSKTYLTCVLYIWVFSHRSKLRLPEGGVRFDKICSEICNSINGSRYYGLGELDLYSVKRFSPMTDYQGKLMTFYSAEINRTYDGKKSIPNNRKNY